MGPLASSDLRSRAFLEEWYAVILIKGEPSPASADFCRLREPGESSRRYVSHIIFDLAKSN